MILYILYSISILLLIVVIYLLSDLKNKKDKKEKDNDLDEKQCILCSSKRSKDEKMSMFIFNSYAKVGNLIEKPLYIYGCSYCKDNSLTRKCPICKKALSKSDHLVARLYIKSNKKQHIRVRGCNVCKKELL